MTGSVMFDGECNDPDVTGAAFGERFRNVSGTGHVRCRTAAGRGRLEIGTARPRGRAALLPSSWS